MNLKLEIFTHSMHISRDNRGGTVKLCLFGELNIFILKMAYAR